MSKKRCRLFVFLISIVALGVTTVATASNNKKELLLNSEFALNEVCNNFTQSYYNNPDTLRRIATSLLDKRYDGNDRFFAFGNYALAEAQYYSRDYKNALNNYTLALDGFINNSDTLRIATAYTSIGVVNLTLGNDVKAYEALLNALNYYNALGYKRGIGISYQNIAVIFWRAKDYTKADDYALRGINIYKELGEYKDLADMYNNYAINLAERKEYDKALNYYQQSHDLFDKKLQNKTRSAIVLYNIGTLYEVRNNTDSAYYYYNSAHAGFLQNNDSINLVSSYQKLAKISITRKDFKEAIELATKAEEFNQKTGSLEQSKTSNAYLALAYEGIGDCKEALRCQKLYQLYSDTICKQESQIKIVNLESKFVVEQTKKEMEALQQRSAMQNFIIAFIGIIFLLAGTAAYFYWTNYRIKAEKRSLTLEHKVLRTQMNPHFIFNSLSALQFYIMDDMPDKALRFLGDFSALLRLVLQYSKSEIIHVSKEKKILEHYLALQNKRFDDKIKIEINVDQELIEQNAMIPPMLAQPFIENSLEHGGLSGVENATIKVNILKVGESIRLTVEDNGIGVDSSPKKEKERTKDKDTDYKSMAIIITRERLSLLNFNQNQKVLLTIKDLSHVGLRGTKVEFLIPIAYQKEPTA